MGAVRRARRMVGAERASAVVRVGSSRAAGHERASAPTRAHRRRSTAVALGSGVLALLAVVIVMIPTLRTAGWSLTALPHVDSNTKLGAAAHAIDPGFRTVHPGAYDGQFYWAIAIDPVTSGHLHVDLDKPSYRYGHPLYGWLAWLVSADHARAVPAALALIGLVSVFAAAAIATLLGRRRGRAGWEGLFVALNPGLVTAAALDLGEPLATALLVAALAAYTRGRTTLCWVALALLPLAKEELGLVVVALVAWELVERRPGRAMRWATAAIPSCVWWVAMRIRLGAWFTSGDTALGRPLSGWASALDGAGSGHLSALRHDAATAALAVVLAVLVLAAARALRLRGPADYAYLALFAVAVCLAANATAEFTTALRNTAFLIALAPFVLVPARPRSEAAAGPAPIAGEHAHPRALT